MNTKITYLYRDASNYKRTGEVVVDGSIMFADLEPFLIEGIYFVPEDVGLEHPGVHFFDAFPTEDDHPYCELDEDESQVRFESTTEPATVDAQDLIERFRTAHAAGWPSGDSWTGTGNSGGHGRHVKKDKCECGAVKIGCGKGSPGHSSWCPWKA